MNNKLYHKHMFHLLLLQTLYQYEKQLSNRTKGNQKLAPALCLEKKKFSTSKKRCLIIKTML